MGKYVTLPNTLNLARIREILKDAPISETDERFEIAVADFYTETIRLFLKQTSNPLLPEELDYSLFKNLMQNYNRGLINTNDCEEILFFCITKRYVSNKSIQKKLTELNDDKALTNKFLSDLDYSILDYYDPKKNKRIKTIRINRIGDNKEWQKDIEIPEQVSYTTEQAMDIVQTDITDLLNSMIYKPAPVYRYIIWKFKRLENIRLQFENAKLQTPTPFYISVPVIKRYFLFSNTGPSSSELLK